MLRVSLTAVIVAATTVVVKPNDARAAQGNTTIIDTIIIERGEVFTTEQTDRSALFRGMNKIHFVTREHVIRRELLFAVGERYDDVLVEESARNLRRTLLFSVVTIDSSRTDDERLAVTVRTQDGWSTSPKLRFQAATDGTVTYNLGAMETNLFGTGNLLSVSYRKDVDRRGLELAAKFDRVFGSAIDADGSYENLSDARIGKWVVGRPFRTVADERSVLFEGESASQRILQYRATASVLDTTIYKRNAFLAVATGETALSATPTRFARLGVAFQIRQEKYVLRQDTGMAVPDSVTAAVAAFVEWRRARFITMRRFNGLGEEDIDASAALGVGFALTPQALGYAQTGAGPELTALGTLPFANGFLTGMFDGHAIFSSAGLDSAFVELRLTAGYKFHPRHATVVHIQGGLMENQSPGAEFDLGFNVPPRSWEPHSFVGTQGFWGTFEHKFFVADALFGLFGMAIAGFVDYGGAWYDDQPARFGGDFGIGLRSASALGSEARTGRLDLGWRFGSGASISDGVVLTIGTGWVFGGGRDPTCVPEVQHVRFKCRPRGN